MDNPINYWYQKYIALKAKVDEMMKEAVEGEVSHYATVHYVKTNESQLSARLKQFQGGDKVRVIIIKED